MTSGAPLRLSGSRQVRRCRRSRVRWSSVQTGSASGCFVGQRGEGSGVGAGRPAWARAQRRGRLRGESWRGPAERRLGARGSRREGTPLLLSPGALGRTECLPQSAGSAGLASPPAGSGAGLAPPCLQGCRPEAAGFLGLRLRFPRLCDLCRVELAWEWELGGGVSRC